MSNLHRQIIHNESRIGTLKVDSAVQTLTQLNSTINIQAIPQKITYNNVIDIIQVYDIVVDATDNIEVRYILSDACILLKKTLVSGSAGKLTCILLSRFNV